jgi:threonine/homoserine/homoserine lactone efflux protein
MNRVIKLFLVTLLVSFLGSLPLGTLNVSITKLTLYKGSSSALLFGTGAIFVELFLVRLAIHGIERLEKAKRYVSFFHWIASFVLLFFSAVSIIAALQMKKFGTSLSFVNKNPFAAGLLLSALNPLHLPFWLSWTAAFKSKGIMSSSHREYNVYVIAIGLGTATAFVVYGWVGRVLILLLENKQFLLNWAVGITLFLTAIFQVRKSLRKERRPAFVLVSKREVEDNIQL